MPWFSLRRDGTVLLVLGLLVVMLWAGLAAHARVFAFTMTAVIGTFAGIGFARRGRPRTWVPPLLATVALATSFAGMFAHEATVVRSAADTWLGFQRGTAFLVYGLWIPAFFTLGLGFALLFDEVAGPTDEDETGTVSR